MPNRPSPFPHRAGAFASTAALLLSLSFSAAALAAGAGGSGDSGTGGIGGGSAINGSGMPGSGSSVAGSDTTSGGGGGGGGTGTTGGSGGQGSSTSGTGGAGGATPGADGAAGSNGGTFGAGGGGGGAHGYDGTTLPVSGATGGSGGKGGDSTGGGGGGGNGGYGAVLDASGGTGIVTGNFQGGSGGAGGDGGLTAQGGAGGGAGHGFVILGASNTLEFSGTITGGTGGSLGSAPSFAGAAGDGGFGLLIIGSNTVVISGSVVGGDGGDQDTAGNGTAGSGGEGIYAFDTDVTITSTGSVSGGYGGSGGAQADAIRFLSGDNTLALEAGATISGNVVGDGNDTLVLTGSGDGSIDYTTQFSGFGGITKRGASTWTLTGSNFQGETLVEAGRLNVNGQIGSSGAWTAVNGGTLGGNGTIIGTLSVNAGGTLAPGGAFDQLAVQGAAIFAAGSFFEVGVDSTGQNDSLAVQGTVVISSDSKVVVNAQPGKYLPSTPYTIITSTGGVTGEFDDNVSSNFAFAFLTPTLDYDGQNVFLTFVNTVAFEAVAQTYNERAVAGALGQLDPNDPLYQLVIGQTQAGARQAFNALSGEIYASTAGVLIDQARFTRGAILDRMLQSSYANAASGQQVALGAGGPTTFALNASPLEGRMALGAGDGSHYAARPSVPAYADGLVFWTQGFGSWGTYDGNGNAATVDRTLGGFVSGVDTAIGGNWRAGAAVGYTRSDLNVSARVSSSNIDSYILSAYAGGPVGSFVLRTGGSWSWNDIEAERVVVFPGFAGAETASYDGDVGQLFAELAHPFIHGSAAVEPFVGLAWVHLSTSGFTETGDPTASLAVRGSKYDIGYSTLGMRFATATSIGSMLVTPRASAAWQYAFGDTTPDLALAFASSGVNFGILGVPLARSSALLEAGLDLHISSEVRLGISYVGQLASDLQDNGVQANVLWRF